MKCWSFLEHEEQWHIGPALSVKGLIVIQAFIYMSYCSFVDRKKYTSHLRHNIMNFILAARFTRTLCRPRNTYNFYAI
jgi:hypothetical protein